MTAVEFRRLAGRVNLLRAHIELAAVGERCLQQREALDRVSELLVNAEQYLVESAKRVTQ